MRMALFETLEVSCSVSLERVLHVLTTPQVFNLPLLRRSFAGGVLYQGQIVPLLAGHVIGKRTAGSIQPPAFALVCEADFGLVAVPADRIVRITGTGEISPEIITGNDSQDEVCEIGGRDYRLLDLNRVLEDPDFSVCRLKD